MRIRTFRTGLLRIPLRTPFKTALRTVESIEDAVIRFETDCGFFGYGEAPPTVAITGDSLDGILYALQNRLGPALVGRDVRDIAVNCAIVQNALPKNTSAKAAAEIALYDLYAQSRALPLYAALGGGIPRLTTDLTISVNDTATMIADCETAIGRGFTALKIKVGKQPEEDVDRLRAIHPRVVLYDAHSIRSRIPRLFEGELPQFNLGTNGGATCDQTLESALAQVCEKSGHSWIANGRFKGGWTTRHYGKPASGIHAVQMELAQRGYMDEPAAIDETNWPGQLHAAPAILPTLQALIAACLTFAEGKTA